MSCALLLALGGCDSDSAPALTDGGRDATRGDLVRGDGTPGDTGLGDTTALDQATGDGLTSKDGLQAGDGAIDLDAAIKDDGSLPKDTMPPDGPAKCGKLGQQIKLGQSCCPGLTPGAVATPPACISLGLTFVCVKCGDGLCDTKSGEDACSCPADCDTPANDCVKRGGYCTPQFTQCKTGYAADGTVSCGAKALTCCMPDKCVGVACPAPTCQMSSAGDCTAVSSICDPNTGNCQTSTTTVNQGCKMKGTACVQTTPSCSASATCATSSTTLTQSCKQSGANCVQTTPSCAQSACTAKTVIVPNATCNIFTGSCTPSGSKCKVDCDCKQGLKCSKGQCIAIPTPVYCCDKAGCPVGKKCTDKSGNVGTCPTTGINDCVKNGGYCSPQFTLCVKGFVIDPTLSCGALALNCCVKAP
ncbi:MAG: hypothetical protein CSA65_04210 [Proteobacteria bacterium]|nr:MAG: hypothetical protein CSA65_04210 [Pseudomonadota bacterium]